jgi:hypothetical protein
MIESALRERLGIDQAGVNERGDLILWDQADQRGSAGKWKKMSLLGTSVYCKCFNGVKLTFHHVRFGSNTYQARRTRSSLSGHIITELCSSRPISLPWEDT